MPVSVVDGLRLKRSIGVSIALDACFSRGWTDVVQGFKLV